MSEVNISNALVEFLGAFEVVFRYDWEYTKIKCPAFEDGRSPLGATLREREKS